MTEAERVAAGLTRAGRSAVMALDGEFRSAASCKPVTTQAVQGLARRHPELIEREFQDGCAMRWYYRLNADGLAVRAILEQETCTKN